MSPNVGNFVHDLVEMAKAVEVLPKIEAELEDTKHLLNDAEQRVQSRELHLIDLNKKIEELTAKLQSAEASRDDAEYRFLEIDEKFTKIRSLVGEIQGNADQIATQAAPEQPKEEPKAEETQSQDQDNTIYAPAPSWATPTPQNEYPTEASTNTPQASEVAPPDPTASSTAGDGHSPSTADTPTNVQSIGNASTQENSFRRDNAHVRHRRSLISIGVTKIILDMLSSVTGSPVAVQNMTTTIVPVVHVKAFYN
jgi:hypothetical protein